MKRVIILFLVLSLLLFIPSALAWNSYTHKTLWQTLSNCDKSAINKILNTSPILSDRVDKDKSSHNCYPTYCPAMDRVNELLSEANKTDNFCQKMFILGQASHYYTDAKDPAHQQIVSENCHSNFESKVDKYIKNNFNSPVKVNCRKPTLVLTFNRTDFKNLVNGIKTDILDVVLW